MPYCVDIQCMIDCGIIFFEGAHQIGFNQQVAGWPSGLRRQFKALVFGRGFESHFSHDAFLLCILAQSHSDDKIIEDALNKETFEETLSNHRPSQVLSHGVPWTTREFQTHLKKNVR